MSKTAGGLFAGHSEGWSVAGLRLRRCRQRGRNEEQHAAGRAMDGLPRLGRIPLQQVSLWALELKAHRKL